VKPRSAIPARLPDFVEPMKAKLVDFMPKGDWIYEIKFDSYRALALRGGSETQILSWNQNDLGSKFPEVKDSIAALDIQDVIIDGEIVALDTKSGERVHAVPNPLIIRDGYWFHEATRINHEGSYTRDHYGNYIEFNP
jgi:bifunctional non-homologous end joining protein LigD